MEQFLTLQGEGFHTGRAAYFIRLGGCDVGCVWCDVKESWDEAAHPKIAVATLAATAKESGAGIAVITGGEPTLHHLAALCSALHDNNIRVHLETSGTGTVTGDIDWITLSPKKFKAPLPENFESADELKIIVYNNSDFDWAEQHAAVVSTTCMLYLQPEWSKAAKITPAIIEYIKENPKWRLSLQSHKYINIP
jgi:7-carboxy-7-deazaguanine synthase